MELTSLVKGKKVVFISTKNLDYLRNTQEIEILKENATSIDVIAFKDRSYVKRILKVYLKCFKLIFKNPYEVTFIGFAPQLVLPFLKSFKKKTTLIIDFFISCYDTFVFDRKKIKDKTFLAKKIHSIDAKTIKNSDFVLCDTKAHRDYFIEEFSLNKELSQVLYLKADTSIYYPRELTRPEETKDKFVVLYFGSILPLQGIDVVLEAAKELENKDNIFIYLIGPLKPEQSEKYKDLKNVKFINWLPQEKLAEKIAEADLCLAGHFSDTINKAKRTIPGKAYIYNAMKKPMILGDSPANHELFKPSDDIFFVEMGNSQKLSDLIIKISEGGFKNENK